MMHSHVAMSSQNRLKEDVLILVVMDDALAHAGKWLLSSSRAVLILVVMDDALALTSKRY